MFSALKKEQQIYEEFLSLHGAQTTIRSDHIARPAVYEDVLWSALSGKPEVYHPLEIVFWKYGSFLQIREGYGQAERYWNRAIEVCDSDTEYETMKIIKIAIGLEKLSLMPNTTRRKEDLNRGIRGLRNFITAMILSPNAEKNYSESMKSYAREAREVLQDFQPDKAFALSRKIAF